MVWRVTFDVRERERGEGETVVFEQDEIIVGRTPARADMIFDHANLSRQHCRFEVRDDGTVWIVDLGSSNGTWVNGMQARAQEFGLADELFAGDRVVRLAKPAQWVEPPPPVEYELIAHPRSEATAIEKVRVLVSRLGDHLELRYVFEGAIERLEVPRGRLDHERLWEHTCAELFVGGADATYVEWNFSPTLQSARFAFSDYRQRVEHEPGKVRVRMERGAKTLVLTARGAFVSAPTADLGLTAITRDVDGAQSFWALAHPSERPDFHHRAGFVAASLS